MTSPKNGILALAFFSLALSTSTCPAQSREDGMVRQASAVLGEVMAIPAQGIPTAMLANAHGVAIIPSVIKGSFIIGARHGKGVLLVRQEDGRWCAPTFISLTGGNIGWQVGVQSTDVILVFKTRKSIDGIFSGKLTIGADAAAAAGPVGRNAAVATDGKLKAEIYSYSRSRGLFAGVSFDGSVISVDNFSGAAYYHSPAPGYPVIIPPAAITLTQQVAGYATPPMATVPTPAIQPPTSPTEPLPTQIVTSHKDVDEAAILRNQLARIAPELYEHLDDQWKTYLALPVEIFAGTGHPSIEMLEKSLKNFEAVRADEQYSTLSDRYEFQSTYGILRHYLGTLQGLESPLKLPSPPGS